MRNARQLAEIVLKHFREYRDRPFRTIGEVRGFNLVIRKTPLKTYGDDTKQTVMYRITHKNEPWGTIMLNDSKETTLKDIMAYIEQGPWCTTGL